MARIAIAGGAGAVGKTFVEALSKTKHHVVVMSRSEQQSKFSNVTYAKVNYSDVSSMVTFLQTNNIDTVLSAITMDSSTTSRAQLNLIAAADQSSVTKRLIPSEFGAVVNSETSAIDPFAKFWVESAEALAKTKLQYSRISAGFFMDYWGMPYIKTEQHPYKWFIDIESGVASIPGTGNEKFSVTYTYDLAMFIVRLLDEPEWPEVCAVVGQDVTLNQMLGWAEAATGRKFKVSYDEIKKLEQRELTPLNEEAALSPLIKEFTALFGLLIVKDLLSIPDENGFRLNRRFPELEAMTAEAMIKATWTK